MRIRRTNMHKLLQILLSSLLLVITPSLRGMGQGWVSPSLVGRDGVGLSPSPCGVGASEFRAVWLTTHLAIDWPHTNPLDTSVSSDSEARMLRQQSELLDILDALQRAKINAVCFQVRPMAEVYYASRFEPWASYLTGVRGEDPCYDPLQFIIREAHSRGMELHAWVNPFRYETNAGERREAIRQGFATDDSDPIRLSHPDWLLSYRNGQFGGTILDPGCPEARDYVVQVIMEIVRGYDIDGIVMDDYFYPYGGTKREDIRSQRAYKPAEQSIGDWRRENVNKFVHAVYDSIQSVKPSIKMGMSPFGIYSMTPSSVEAFGLTLPEEISGSDPWAVLYCDPLRWAAEGYVDYLSPQLYWSTESKKQDYDVLCRWWSEALDSLNNKRGDNKAVHLYVSHAAFRFGVDELARQVEDNRLFAPDSCPGSIFYNTTTFLPLADSLAVRVFAGE